MRVVKRCQGPNQETITRPPSAATLSQREGLSEHILATPNNDVYCRRVMQVMNEYIGIAVSFVLAGGITALMVLLSSTLGKKNPTPVKLAPFECGKEPFSLPVGRFAIKFYLIGILFICSTSSSFSSIHGLWCTTH